MKWALGISTLGVVGVSWIGTQILGLDLWFCGAIVLVSNVAGLIALVITQRLIEHPRTGRILKGGLRSWGMLTGLYLAGIYGLLPELWNLRLMSWLIVPMLFCMGFAMIAYGPIQDLSVRRRQRGVRRKAVATR